jgi:hypothetical protein
VIEKKRERGMTERVKEREREKVTNNEDVEEFFG